MRNLYITIDLSFWARTKVDLGFLHRLLEALPAADRIAAVFHDSILPHTRRYADECTRLVNLDCRSDLAGCENVQWESGEVGNRLLPLHPGSWADYVKLYEKAEFAWAYPYESCPERCRTDAGDPEEPFSELPQLCTAAWTMVRSYLAQPPDYGIRADEARAISIVLSPNYCGPDALGAFMELIRAHHLELLDCLPENVAAIKPEEARPPVACPWSSRPTPPRVDMQLAGYSTHDLHEVLEVLHGRRSGDAGTATRPAKGPR